MSEMRLGDISLRDYRRIMEPPRWSRLRKGATALVALMLCLLCTAAGDYWGPWTGKGSRQLSFEQARALLDESSPEEWVTEIGLGRTFQHIERAMIQMRDTALRKDPGSDYASNYLRTISTAGIEHIRALQSQGDAEGRHAKHLEQIRQALPQD